MEELKILLKLGKRYNFLDQEGNLNKCFRELIKEFVKYLDLEELYINGSLIYVLNDDLFRDLLKIYNYHIILKEPNEYGIQITSYKLLNNKDKYIKDGIRLFVDDKEPNDYYPGFYITLYEYYENGKRINNGLKEIIYSNRTEYYINDKYISSDIDDLEYIHDQINERIIDDKVYPWLFELITSDYYMIIVDPEEDKVDFKI